MGWGSAGTYDIVAIYSPTRTPTLRASPEYALQQPQLLRSLLIRETLSCVILITSVRGAPGKAAMPIGRQVDQEIHVKTKRASADLHPIDEPFDTFVSKLACLLRK